MQIYYINIKKEITTQILIKIKVIFIFNKNFETIFRFNYLMQFYKKFLNYAVSSKKMKKKISN